MCRKLILLTSFVLVLGFVNINNAQEIAWTGLGADNFWSTAANWEGNKVPTAADEVAVDVPGAAAPNGPLIQDGIDAECNLLYNEVAGEPTMTMTGGTLTISGWGIWWGDGQDCVATFYMSGGTMSLTGSPGIHEFAWGGASGTWIMTGGTVYAKGVKLTTSSGVKGEIFLHGGTYNIGTERGGLNMEEGNGLIDITEGTLVLEGDETAKINGLIAAGKITAYGGAGIFEMDYDGRNPGSTTVTAVEAGRAYKPNPANGAIYPDTWASLSWSPADDADSHNVYFGDNFDDVKDGTGDTFQGNQKATFLAVGFPGFPYPDGLVPGTTYYWRIEEVDADGNTIHKGDIWSFTIPPKTAYDPNPADGAEFVDPNVELSWAEGFGAILHTVYFGDNFDDVDNATDGLSQGEATYTPGLLELEKVYYWRVDEYDALDTYKGDVWSFTTPGAVGSPNPSNGAIDVQMTATLSWTPADNAASHQVYFGTDKGAVRNADTASPEYIGTRNLGLENYDPGELAWNITYYWRVDEVYDADPANPVKGPLWSFTTADFILVDDFESYNDIEETEPGSNVIYDTWIDGWEDPTNGSIVGYLMPPHAEVKIVHGGSQSMPYSYDNDLKYSEATLPLVWPRDWTQESVGVLSLWFSGDASNAAELMYVALNGSATVYHDNPDAALIDEWTEWTIDLEEFAAQGVNLTNVNTISIGFGDKNNLQAGGSGKVYFDDIRLYRPGISEVSPITITVPNGDFEEIYKPGSDTITADLGGGWTQGVGPDAPMDDGIATYSDGTSGDWVDIPGWIGTDTQGWIDAGGTYGRDTDFPNRQGSIARQSSTPDGLYYYLSNGGGWGNPAGGLIVSDAPLGNVEDGTYTLSMVANGGATPVVLELLADGVALTPSSSVDPVLSDEWQEFSRTYDAASLGGHLGESLTIRLGVGRGASGAQSHFDAVSLSYVPEAPPEAYWSPVAIVNPGFEIPAFNDGDWDYLMDNAGWGWFANDNIGSWNIDSGNYGGSAPEGENIGWTSGDGVNPGGFAQVLTETLTAGMTYKLTVEVGNTDGYDWGGYRVQLLAGGTPQATGTGDNYAGEVTGGIVLAEDDNTLTIANDTFETSTVTYTYNPELHSGSLGDPLQIRLLGIANTGNVDFDDVRFEAAE